MKKENSSTIKGFKLILTILFLLMFLAGLAMVLMPKVQEAQMNNEIRKELYFWKDSYQPTTGVDESKILETEPIYPDLLSAMAAYNEKIFTEGQSGLVDAWSYQQETFDLTQYGVEDRIVGYITIPAIGIELPLYLGCSYENLTKGFAQLGQTSMPIGGMNTNCVVACHRGWNGAAFLRDADQLKIDDTVEMRNFWETLQYRICEIKIIEPYEVNEILIQPNKDMLTIVTCTPYGVGSQRLIIYCERITESALLDMSS